MNELEKFTEYLNYVYGANGIYSVGYEVSQDEVKIAIDILKKTNIPFQGDSLDRERAFDILYTDSEREILNSY